MEDNNNDRMMRLKKIAFDCKSEFVKDDKNAYGRYVVGIVLSPFLMFELLKIGVFNSFIGLLGEFGDSFCSFISGKLFLLGTLIALLFVTSIMNLVFTLVIHGKLKLKKVFDEDTSLSVSRIRKFKKRHAVKEIFSLVFGLLGKVLVAVLLYSVVVLLAPRALSTGETAIFCGFAALFCILAIVTTIFGIKQFSSQCDELVEVLEL